MIRTAEEKDLPDIIKAADRVWDMNPHNQMKYIDYTVGHEYIANAVRAGRLVIVSEQFAVMYDVGTVWYSSEPFLIEELVLRIHPGDAHVSAAILAIDHLATIHGCKVRIVGDSQVGYMVPHYIKAGYTPIVTQLMKD